MSMTSGSPMKYIPKLFLCWNMTLDSIYVSKRDTYPMHVLERDTRFNQYNHNHKHTIMNNT